MINYSKEELGFEKRLYKHWIYTNTLYNLVQDLVSDLSDRRFECSVEHYKSGKYCYIIVNNYDETFEQILQFLLEEYDPNYLGSLGYYTEEENKFYFYIKI